MIGTCLKRLTGKFLFIIVIPVALQIPAYKASSTYLNKILMWFFL